MKLRKADRLVLYALAFHGELYGLDLVHVRAGRRGSIYVRLGRLEDRALVSRRDEDRTRPGMTPRSLFAITDAGKAALGAGPG